MPRIQAVIVETCYDRLTEEIRRTADPEMCWDKNIHIITAL